MTIDWSRGERLLLVHGGSAPNPGYGLVIDSIGRPALARSLEVRAHLSHPAPGRLFPQVLAHPCQLVHLAGPGAAGSSDEVELRFLP